VSKEHNQECIRLLKLMGVPVVEAPSEAEAQCAAMCKHGLVYAVGSEDMDTLTFAATKLARNVCAPKSQDKPILEFDYAEVGSGPCGWPTWQSSSPRAI
jgi:flap endonuclease-1